MMNRKSHTCSARAHALKGFALIMLAAAVFSGCQQARPDDATRVSTLHADREMIALQTHDQIAIDGKLDEPIWKNASAYSFTPVIRKDSSTPPKLLESARVRFAWDDRYLYVAFECDDSDVVAEATSDGQHLYQFGDVCELFIKPDQHPWYWEFHVSPRSQQATFFWPSHGRRLPSALQSQNALTVAAQISGTLNNYHDRDRGWTAEMAVPWTLIKSPRASGDASLTWRVLVGRYNYSVYLPDLEYSSFPQLTQVDFHQTDRYLPLRLVPRADSPPK